MQENTVQRRTSSFQLNRVSAIILGAGLMLWPAIFNRFPLFYPDSMTYLADGRPVARALFLDESSDYYGMRSFIYSLGILPFHWNVTPWPVIVFHALLTAFVIWLTVRSLLPHRTIAWYLLLVALLSVLTSLSWFVSLLMPDILGPLLYLCIYLLVFAGESLTRSEHLAVAAIACWAIASHTSHLMLAAGLCIFLTVVTLISWRDSMRPRLKAVGEVAALILLAAAAQIALNAYLYGEPSLNGDRPPYLTARLISDGPGRWYLEQHCPDAKFALCNRVRDLQSIPGDDSDEFLWGANGIWSASSPEVQHQILVEEVPFALATLRAYPRAQLSKSAANFWNQLTSFEEGFDANDWMLEQFDSVLSNGKSRYLKSRQSRNDLPFDFFSAVLEWTVVASIVLIALFAIRLWRLRARPPRLIGLSVVVVTAVIANAFITGTLSTVEDRYQSRVVWLVPLLAAMFLMDWLAHRVRASHAAA